MRKISGRDIKDMHFLKYYRLVRKWACKQNKIKDADLELIIYLESVGQFTRNDFTDGTFVYTWDKHRWERLRRDGWIDVWRNRNNTTQKYTIYQVSRKAKYLITRIYKILAGEENIPVLESSVFYKNRSYTDKVYNKAIEDMYKDKER